MGGNSPALRPVAVDMELAAFCTVCVRDAASSHPTGWVARAGTVEFRFVLSGSQA